MLIDGVIQLVTAGLGALGFSMVFNVRRNLLPAAAFGGLLDWGVYLAALWFFGGVFLPSVVAAAFASIYSEAVARMEQAPATVFYIPALIPLVPGGSLYYTMNYALNEQWSSFAAKALYTLELAAALALGIIAVTTLTRMTMVAIRYLKGHKFHSFFH